jgi:hypothetical protein
MRNLIFLLPLLVIFGCEEVSFKEPQPKGKKSLNSVPRDLRGKYLLAEDKKDPGKDTLIIEAQGFRFGYYDETERTKNRDEGYYKGGLGDSLVLKSYKGYYFWNFNESPEWRIRIVKKEQNGNLTLMEPGKQDVEFKAFLKDLSSVVPIDTVVINGEKLYQIDPAPKQLIELVEKGYFVKSVLQKVQ